MIDLAIGLTVVLVGLGLALLSGIRNAVPLGLAICIAGLVLLLSGLSRITARMEVSKHPIGQKIRHCSCDTNAVVADSITL